MSPRRPPRTVDRPTVQSPEFVIDELLADTSVRTIVCTGSGGVGKTTMAAAVGLRAAERGRRVVVLTIDPARRLAQALGLGVLDNLPAAVPGVDPSSGGSLQAMMLDMKRTFDEVVEQHAAPDKAAQILANPFYQAVSSSFAGTQEYMAMEKLGQLRAQADRDGSWDLIIVDTPPSRSALDFLDAPKRLGSFLDGRFIRLISAPAKAGGRVYLRALSAGVAMATNALGKILGGQMLTDVQTFVAALDTMFGGFRERADATYALLKEPSTAFVVVATPERDALREASYFIERLGQERMPLAGVVLNRVRTVAADTLSGARATALAEDLQEVDPDSPTIGILHAHAELAATASRHTAQAERFVTIHPGVPMTKVPASARDIHDLTALRQIGAALSGETEPG
ncbi:MAG: ArsA family ATPase [Nostocoides sp.]